MQTVPAWWVILVALSGMATAWLAVVLTARRDRAAYEKDRLAREAAQSEANEKLAKRVCREWTESSEWRRERDERIKEVANREIDDSFRERSSSFVDSADFERFVNMILDQHKSTNALVIDLSMKVGEMDGRISAAVAHQVTQQLTAYLSSTILTGRLRGGGGEGHGQQGQQGPR